MKRVSFGTRLLALCLLIVALALPAWAAVQRVCNLNAVLPNPAIKSFKVYAYAGLDGEKPMGRAVIGPPAWDDATQYFSGDAITVERQKGGVKLAFSGTFGSRIQSSRKPMEAFVTVADGKVTVAGLPPDYCVSDVKPSSGSLTIYPAPVGSSQ